MQWDFYARSELEVRQERVRNVQQCDLRGTSGIAIGWLERIESSVVEGLAQFERTRLLETRMEIAFFQSRFLGKDARTNLRTFHESRW